MKVSFTNLTKKKITINYRTLANSESVDFIILPPFALNLEFDLPQHKVEAIEKQLETNKQVIMIKTTKDKAIEKNQSNETQRISHALELSTNEIQNQVDFNLLDSVVLSSNDDEINPSITQEISKNDSTISNKKSSKKKGK